MQQHQHFLFIGSLLFGPSHDQRCCQERRFPQRVGMHPMGAAGANREGVVALFARTRSGIGMFGTPSNWLGGVRPCQWTIVSSPVCC